MVQGLLMHAGLPSIIASQIHFLHTRLKRYIMVVGSYVGVIQQTNGVGQGCSLSIDIANLYVTTFFRYVQHSFPDIEMGAFVDDRNVTTKSIDDLLHILDGIQKFDQIAN